jgi:hypothetical protein
MCGLIVLLASVLFAKEVTVYGTVIDTVFETGGGKEPVLKIAPAQACSVFISAGCTEQPASKYFARTGSDGNFSVKINLPDTCQYGQYNFNVACTTSNKSSLYQNIFISDDSPVESIKANLTRQIDYIRDSIQNSGYSYYLSFSKPSQTKGGDTLRIRLVTKALVDNPDTLKSGCGGLLSLATSTNMVVAEQSIKCNYPSFTFLSQKNSYFEQLIEMVIPKDLQQRKPDFKTDRTLTLSLRMGSSEKIIRYSFTVLDTDIIINNTTSVQKSQRIKTSNSFANLSMNWNNLYLDIGRAGNYSVELFSPNGRLIQRIAQNQYFENGKHTFTVNTSSVNSSQILLARLKGDGVKASTILLKQ